MNRSSNDIINNFIKNNSHLKEKVNSVTQEELKKSIKNVNRSEVSSKLRSMGLGNVADKLSAVSDEELIQLISKNPELVNKINSFLK